MIRKIFLEDLYIHDHGKNKGSVDWGRCIGRWVRFVYSDIEGKVQIISYDSKKQKIRIEYNGKIYGIYTSNFIKCCLGKIVGRITGEFKIEIGKMIIDDKRNLIITDREYRKRNNKMEKQKWYKYTCNKCGWTEGWIVEGSLMGSQGCSCCCGITVVEGINDIFTTNFWMVKLGIAVNDSKSNTSHSNKKIKVICPDCGKIMLKQIGHIYTTKSIGCVCGDGYSYPEKFIYSMLKQLNVEFVTQLSSYNFKWCNRHRYDFYLLKHNVIIEVHGSQHYESKYRGKTIEEEQENDRIKTELALRNGIKEENYIILNCRKSELEWIKNSVLSSSLVNMFDLSKVNWLKCEESGLSNKIKEVCSAWKDKREEETAIDLASKFNLSPTTTRSYLKKGTSLGWCDYDAKKEFEDVLIRNRKLRMRAIEIYKDGVLLGIFESYADLARKSENLLGTKLNSKSIYSTCSGRQRTYKGYIIKRVEL